MGNGELNLRDWDFFLAERLEGHQVSQRYSCWYYPVSTFCCLCFKAVIFSRSSLIRPPAHHTVVVQSLSHVQLPAPPWAAASEASLSFTTSRGLLQLMPVELVIHLTISSSVAPFSSSQSFPAAGSFSMSWLFTSGDQRSAWVLPMNIQGCISDLTFRLSIFSGS